MTDVTRVGKMEFERPNDTQLVATRVIDAPRDLVWAAHTRCDHVREWLTGPEGWSMPECRIDLRPGQGWRYVYEGPGARGFAMSGEYREVREPDRIVNTERMDGAPGETVNSLSLSERDGHTLVRTVVDYPSREIREEIIGTGMMDGWAESYDRLESYLQTAR